MRDPRGSPCASYAHRGSRHVQLGGRHVIQARSCASKPSGIHRGPDARTSRSDRRLAQETCCTACATLQVVPRRTRKESCSWIGARTACAWPRRSMLRPRSRQRAAAKQPAAGPSTTKRCAPSARRRRSRPPTRTTSTTWTAACRSRPEEIKGRNMWIVWTGGNDRFWDVAGATEPRHARLPEDGLVASDAAATRATTAGAYLGLVNEPCFKKADRAGSEPLRPVARRARSGLPARPVRQRGEVPGRADRRARQDRAGRLLLRRAHRHRRPAPVPESRLRRERAQGVGLGALLQRPDLLRLDATSCGRTASACRAASATSARTRSSRRPIPRTRSGRTSARTSARSTSGGTASSTGRATPTAQLPLPGAPHLAARHARHLARLDRQHQQPADDERGLLPRPAHGPGEALGQGDDRRRRARQQAVQRLRAAGDPLAAVLRDAGHDVDAARAQGRLRFGRRARRAQPRLPEHRPVQRGVAAALPAADRRAGRSRRSRSRTRRRTRSTGRPPSCRRRTWRGSSSASTAPHLPEGRAGRPVAT